MLEPWPNARVKAVLVERVDLGRRAQRHTSAQRDLDGDLRTLLRRHAPKEGEIVTRRRLEVVEIARQPVVDGAEPARGREWLALMVGDRSHRHVAELGEQGRQIRQIQAAMQGSHPRCLQMAPEWKVQEVGVDVDDVELASKPRHIGDLEYVPSEWIAPLLRQARRASGTTAWCLALVCESALANRVTS